MNKKFYFGLAATAALFASCSSDDVAVDESRAALNDGDRAAIELLIGSPNSATRGTGTVGDLAGESANKWGGQEFNVYMLNKGTLDVAKDAENNVIYENTVFTAPNELAGVAEGTPAMQVTASADGGLTLDTKVSYFPQEGNFDFWAYRTDGAEGANVPTVVNDSLVLDFTIDGSQDIMTSKAVPNVAENTGADAGTYGAKKVPESRIFSAYSVRREVKPMLTFQHQLARLTFKVKGNKDLCVKSVAPATSLSDTVATNDLAVLVTGIEVKSLASGKLNVAYITDPTNIINWTPNSEAPLPLQQRGVDYTPAELEWLSCNGVGYGTITVGSNTSFVFDGNTTVYTAQTVDAKKGLPLAANAKTAAQATTDGDLASCYLCNIKTGPIPGAISVNADLEALEPVAPVWNTTSDKEFATPVGEALLVAPQLNYQLTVKTIQKVAKTTQTKYCTIPQILYNTLCTATISMGSATSDATEFAAAADGFKFDCADWTEAQNILKHVTVAGTYIFHVGMYFRKVDVTAGDLPVASALTYYFATAADADAAVDAYAAWYADQSDDAKTSAKNDALAKGTTTNGGAITVVTSYTWKPDSKTITLNGPSSTTGSTVTYKPYKANKSYTITLTLAGMEPITGETGNIGIGGYEVDPEGDSFDIDMDEQPSVNP